MSGLLLRYVDAFLHQVSQSAACNGRHQIEQRLARWILMTNDRIQSDRFLMTQEFMSHMLGVQRPGVSLAIRALQRAGLVQHEKGHMRVLDRPGLEAAACECYGAVQRRYAWLTSSADALENCQRCSIPNRSDGDAVLQPHRIVSPDDPEDG